MAIDQASITYEVGQWNEKDDAFQCASLFPDVEMFKFECEKLIKAVNSSKLFIPTEYHFYMMWSIMSVCSDIDTDHKIPWFKMHGEEAQNIIEEGYRNREGQDCIDYCETICNDAESSFSYIEDIYFWNLDFLSSLFGNKDKSTTKQSSQTKNRIATVKDLRLMVYKEKIKNK